MSPTEYKEAFEAGQRAVSRLDPRAGCRLCFLSATWLVDVDDELLDRPHELCNEALPGASRAASSASERGPIDSQQEILIFCAQCRDDKNDMQGEGQKIVNTISGLLPSTLRPLYNPRPTPQDLQATLRRATDKVVGLHFIGHGESEGLFFVSEDGKRPAHVKVDRLQDMLRSAPSIQVCLFNACATEDLGRQLRDEGVKCVVVCWRGNVADLVAERFSMAFYATLNETPGNFRKAFEQGKLAATMLQEQRYFDGERWPVGAPCYLSCESVSGADILPDKESFFSPSTLPDEIDGADDSEAAGLAPQPAEYEMEMQEEISVAQALDTGGGSEEELSLNNIKGAAVLAALKELNFRLDYNGYSIEVGIRLYQQGQLPTAVRPLSTYGLEEKVMPNGNKVLFLSNPAARAVFGVRSYTDRSLWKNGVILRQAQSLEVSKVQKAIQHFKYSLKQRRAGGNTGHNFMRSLLLDCVKELGADVLQRQLVFRLASLRYCYTLPHP